MFTQMSEVFGLLLIEQQPRMPSYFGGRSSFLVLNDSFVYVLGSVGKASSSVSHEVGGEFLVTIFSIIISSLDSFLQKYVLLLT